MRAALVPSVGRVVGALPGGAVQIGLGGYREAWDTWFLAAADG